MPPLTPDELHDIEYPLLGKDIDPRTVGLALSEALIERMKKLRPSTRRRVLRVIRERLLHEGGMFAEFMTGSLGR